jgi:GNAT superfamily N-acetyltransferase
MELIELDDLNSEEFRKAWIIYESSFPSDERRDLKNQIEVMNNDLYTFFGVFHFDVLIGIFTEWTFRDFLFVEHIAIKKELRGKGFGTKLFEEYLKDKKKKVILEVEPPQDSLCKKRINFYNSLGFKLNNFNYIQPAYAENKKPVPMILMSYAYLLGEEEFNLFREKLHKQVYGLDEVLID